LFIAFRRFLTTELTQYSTVSVVSFVRLRIPGHLPIVKPADDKGATGFCRRKR